MVFPSLEQINAEIAKRDLREFVKQAWHVLEPNTHFFNNWHIDAICDHLTACSRGEITKLIINVPPGHMKSLLTCVFWCTWEWLTKPHLRWLFASYASHLSVRDSIKTRVLIQSEWYQKNFSSKYQLVKTNEQLITNNKLGFRYATSVSGVGTGERVHRVVNDDLLNATDAHSEAMREQAIKHMEAMATRGVPTEPFVQVLIMQRLHEADPTGWAMQHGGWEQLILPAEFDSKRCAKTIIGFTDPRKEDGELLWPELFNADKIGELKKALGSYGSAAQLQQLPAPADGGIIKLEWFANRYFKQLNPAEIEYYVQSWDTAFKTGKENDYSVCTTWAMCKKGYYLVDRYKAKIEFPELKRMLVALYNQYKPKIILIEDKASGQSLIQELQRETRLPIKPVKVDTDKMSRVYAVTPTLETNVYLPDEAAWLRDYIDNLLVFPNGAHDDDVDSTSQALAYMTLNKPRPVFAANISIMGR